VSCVERGYEDDFTTPFWQHWLGPLAADAAFLEWWRRLRRSMGSPAARYAQAKMNRLIDVRPILPSIRVPTLIIVREDDRSRPSKQATGKKYPINPNVGFGN
jgi:pimeloyl-ACP methyl ester carboxylesterase